MFLLSATEFWKLYRELQEPFRQATKRTYRLWKDNPRASALRFKKRFIRIGTAGYRAIAADVFLDNWFA